MTYIKRVTMTGFKSFGNRTVSVSLAKGFTCIIGPNGNGKSNVIDALCFALGRMSKKTMRAKSLTDLIFAGSKTTKAAPRAEVTITFDNRNREFPDDSDEFDISRWVKAKGQSGYKIQGKKSTRELLLNALAQANIDPDGSNQFILQGKIVELTHMNTVNRRVFIETLIGLEKYDQMKARTLKELEKADTDLGQFEAIFKEVSQQLKKVEKEKNDALQWKQLDNSIKQYNAQLIALKIFHLRQREEEIAADIESTQLVMEELQSRISRQKEKIETENLLLNNIKEDLSGVEAEKAKIEEDISQQRSDLSAKEATLEATKGNLKRLEATIEKLQNLQEELAEGQTFDDLISLSSGEIDVVEERMDETSEIINETIQEQKKREVQIGEINEQKTAINKDISKVNQDIKGLSTEINLSNKNINKNTKKLVKLEKELSKLKKEGESIDDAVRAAQVEKDEISGLINELKKKIEDQKSQQKDLDEEIKNFEIDRDKAMKRQADIQASVSSTSAEINLFDGQINDLEEKKAGFQKEYDRLTKGKPVEDQIKGLKKQESILNKAISEAKDKLKKANDEQKSSQNRKETFEIKRRSLENEVGDLEKRISNVRYDLKNSQTELKKSEREKNEKTLHTNNLSGEIKTLTVEKDKLSDQAENIKKKLEKLNVDREDLQEKIDKKADEQEASSHELEGVMETVHSLIQDIGRSAGNIKSDIQNATQVAIDVSKKAIENFILDITEMMEAIQEVTTKETNEIKQELEQVIVTLNFLIENSEQPIQQLNDDVRDASEEALEESTSNFDTFVSKFIENFDSIRIALQAIGVSDTSDQYKLLDSLNESIQRDQNQLLEISNNLTKIESNLEQKEEQNARLERDLNELIKNLKDNNEKIKNGNTEIDEKTSKIENLKKEIEDINKNFTEIKQFSDNFWKSTKDLQSIIDLKSDELNGVISDLNSLGTVKRFLEDIESATKDQEKLQENIKNKKKSIEELNQSNIKAQEETKSINEKISKIKQDRESAEDVRTDLEAQIEAENEKLNESISKLKDLENVQKLISDIENLNNENEENNTTIEEDKEKITTSEGDIVKLDEQIDLKNSEIDGIQSERGELEQKENEQRESLSDLSNEKNALEKKRDKQQQMKDREIEIENMKSEVMDLQDNIIDFEDSIKYITEEIGKFEEERTEKSNAITELNNQINESWEKQKTLRDELGELNTDLSMNTTKFNNLENEKIYVEEKIDEYFEKSKDFGTLPPVSDDLDETQLTNSINKVTNERTALEPVNLKSIEEFEQVRERWDEIDMRRQTLQRERKAILDSIERIELEKTRNFMKAYHEINRVFSSVFQKLSPGGSAKMILENPAHPFEGGITIEARPRGKKISSLTILSGGEKTLVALSFIFAVQNFYPAPFYIMDEIDAALDGPNVYRVSMVIKEYAAQSQFLVISHREENITNSEIIYGVARNEGITDIFNVNLEEEKDRDDFGSQIDGIDEKDMDAPIVTDVIDD